MDPRKLEMTVLMTPDMANFSGKVHGGALLNLLDRVAFSCASRYSQRYAVTLSVDQVVFKEPINVVQKDEGEPLVPRRMPSAIVRALAQ